MKITLENKDYLDFLKSIPDESIDFVCIDPPYGVLKGHKIETIINIPLLTSEVKSVLKKNGFYAFFGMEPTIKEFEFQAYNYLNYKQEVIWCKRDAPVSMRINRVHEKIMIYVKGSSDYFQYKAPYEDIKLPDTLYGLYNIESVFRELSYWRAKACGRKVVNGIDRNRNRKSNDEYYNFASNMSESPTLGKSEGDVKFNTIWSFLPENKVNKNGNNHKHPTVKPLKLLERLIKLCTAENATVLDCFSGTGTTAVACKNTNRNFVGCELFSEYYENSMQRLANTQPPLFQTA